MQKYPAATALTVLACKHKENKENSSSVCSKNFLQLKFYGVLIVLKRLSRLPVRQQEGEADYHQEQRRA